MENFFPSITQVDLAKYIADHKAFFSQWTALDIDLVCKLVCRQLVLTIGAPSSPGLSNALCYEMDVRLDALSTQADVKYTRYADDLFFSTVRPNVLQQIEADVGRIISELTVPADLKINTAKTRHSSKRGARRVTGIVLGSDGKTYIGRGLKRKIRALIHQLHSLNAYEQSSLSGMIAFAAGFDPNFVNSLITKYGLPVVRKAQGR